ncbi:hypothetical protein ccbrp13_52300 [Ktedonobacteria bacterium brp13]|nr:hypothetical protein ccbrp13_52300 [Ktedonobacteria bacterium brp13]
MNTGELSGDQQMTTCRPSLSRYLVVADGRVVYEGEDEAQWWYTSLRVGKNGARRVTCFVNGKPLIFSRAVL